jgi:hypothetical protein
VATIIFDFTRYFATPVCAASCVSELPPPQQSTLPERCVYTHAARYRDRRPMESQTTITRCSRRFPQATGALPIRQIGRRWSMPQPTPGLISESKSDFSDNDFAELLMYQYYA